MVDIKKAVSFTRQDVREGKRINYLILRNLMRERERGG
jgi:hypothetical protein